MSDVSNEIVPTGQSSSVAGAVQSLADGKQTVFSTIQGDDFASKMKVLTATTASLPLSENLNKPIDLVDVVVQVIEMADEQTGELGDVPRTILIAADGKAYHAISRGVFRAVENILGILGSPNTWENPVKVKVLQEGTGNRKYFTIVPA